MDNTKHWFERMLDLLTTIKAGFAASGFTTFWGWFSDVTLTGVVGICGVLFTAWLGYRRHLREEESHKRKMKGGHGK